MAFTNLNLEVYSGDPGEAVPAEWAVSFRNVQESNASTDVRPSSTGASSFHLSFAKEGFNQATYYQQGYVPAGAEVTLTGWVKSLDGVWYGQGCIGIFDGANSTWDSSGIGWYVSSWGYNTQTWVPLTAGPMTASGNTITLWVIGEGHWGEVFFDDLELTISGAPIPTETPIPSGPTSTIGPSTPTRTFTRTHTPTNTLPPITGFLMNPNFEEGFTNGLANGWTEYRDPFYEGARHLVGDDHASEGSHSQKLLMPIVMEQKNSRKFGVYQRIRAVPGGTYTVTMDYRTLLHGEESSGNDLVCTVGLDPYGDTVPNPHGTYWSPMGGSFAWNSLTVSGKAVHEYITVFCVAMRKWPQLGDGHAWIDHVRVTGPEPPTFTPTWTGTPPTHTPTATSTPTPPSLVGPELIVNGDFEGIFTDGVANGWQKWQTAGGTEAFWRRSTLAGPIGAGAYGGTAKWESEIMDMDSKVVLLGFGYDKAPEIGALPEFRDSLIIGRVYIDHYTSGWISDPSLTDEDIIRNAREVLVDGTGPLPPHFIPIRTYAEMYPRIDAWCALNEPGVDSDYSLYRHALWEKAMTERLHELGLKSVVLNLGVGNPGNPYRMLDTAMRELLEIADYMGYHCYGGPNDQLMVKRWLDGNNLDNPYDFALRWGKFVDWYEERGWRMPPVVYTEGTTYAGWKSAPGVGQGDVVEDLRLFGGIINSDPWALGMTLFCSGSSEVWMDWNIAGTGIGAEMGTFNRANPVDRVDGLRAQQFGKGRVNTLTAYTHEGLFNGGIMQQINGLVPGAYYKLHYFMKYEFAGMQPNLSLFHGIDSTGQTADGNAPSIRWSVDHVAAGSPTETHEVFYEREETFQAESETVSVWLRASHPQAVTSFRLTVDGVSIRRIDPAWIPPDQGGGEAFFLRIN